jgi:TolB-like protein
MAYRPVPTPRARDLTMASIRLDLLGAFQVGSPPGFVIAISSKKARALLAYLAMQGRAEPREKLIGLLWSTREQAHAYNSLRHELVELRRALEPVRPAPLLVEAGTIGLAPGAWETDVAAFERRAAGESIEELRSAADLYRGELLAGLVVRDDAFEAWLAGERDRLSALATGVLERLAGRETGAAAVAVSRRLLALDPLREASHRAVMRAHARQGETELALRQYGLCREILRRELAADPAAETEALHAELRAGPADGSPLRAAATARTDAARAPGEPTKPLMAVLPFDVLGSDTQLEAVAAGLVEDITTGMARFRLVSVISRHATLACRNRAVPWPQIGRQLGAHYILAGSLRRSGDRVRATAQLVETELGRELWAEQYDRSLIHDLAIQDELTQAIVAGIEHVLVAAEHRRALASGGTEQRDLNRKAGWHLFRFTREDNAKAIALLRRAIAENPEADRRYQGLALALGLDLAFGWAERPDETIAEMVAFAERAVALGAHDSWNHAPLSWGLAFARRFDRALAVLRRMIELNPNSGVSYGVSAVVLGHCGPADAALEMLERARRMAPHAPFMFNYLCGGALALFRQGRHAAAADMAESAGLRRPNYFQPHLIQAAALAHAGAIDRARPALAAARRIAPAISLGWLRPLMPLREEGDLVRLVDGLRAAGLPE